MLTGTIEFGQETLCGEKTLKVDMELILTGTILTSGQVVTVLVDHVGHKHIEAPEAASEPETRALMGLVTDIKPVFNISYHSYSELVLYPYGCPGEKTATHALVSSIGQKIGELLDYTPGTPWEILYGVDGGDVDWMYADEQVIPYVIELEFNKRRISTKLF